VLNWFQQGGMQCGRFSEASANWPSGMLQMSPLCTLVRGHGPRIIEALLVFNLLWLPLPTRNVHTVLESFDMLH
jgi:hypothetical protein